MNLTAIARKHRLFIKGREKRRKLQITPSFIYREDNSTIPFFLFFSNHLPSFYNLTQNELNCNCQKAQIVHQRKGKEEKLRITPSFIYREDNSTIPFFLFFRIIFLRSFYLTQNELNYNCQKAQIVHQRKEEKITPSFIYRIEKTIQRFLSFFFFESSSFVHSTT